MFSRSDRRFVERVEQRLYRQAPGIRKTIDVALQEQLVRLWN